MRDPNRIDKVCLRLAELWKSNVPDWRLTQLFCNMQRHSNSDLFYQEDDIFLDRLEKYITRKDEEQ